MCEPADVLKSNQPPSSVRSLRTWGFPSEETQVNQVSLIFVKMTSLLNLLPDGVNSFHANYRATIFGRQTDRETKPCAYAQLPPDDPKKSKCGGYL